MSQRKKVGVVLALAVLGVAGFLFWPYLSLAATVARQKISAPKTVTDRMTEYGPTVRTRLAPDFVRAGVAYPPARLALLGFKQERRLDVYAASATGTYHLVRSYPILAASGALGPKLRQGDGQVPEGLYRINFLNPNSRFHLSLRVNYPNDFDRTQAKADGRAQLGGDIMIHGNQLSAGCLAMGDDAAEDLFVLVADVGLPNVEVVLCPLDFRAGAKAVWPAGLPAWVNQLYGQLQGRLVAFPVAKGRAA